MSGLRTLVTLAVLTYHRPRRLPLTIQALLEQIASLPAELSAKVAVDVTVIDNAPEPEAEHIVALDPGTISYHHEPTPGISAARNRALDESSDYRVLIFVDDDIIPEPRWLQRLLNLWLNDSCQGVVGHIQPEFMGPVDPWITAGRFFVRPQRPTGTEVPAAASNNLLLDLDFVRAHQLRFSLALGQIGGEDSLFTRQLISHGGRILWCNEAKAKDPVPDERATRGWVRQRSIRVGTSEALVALFMDDSAAGVRSRMQFMSGGALRLAGGTLRRALGKLTGQLAVEARGARTQYRGLGHIIGSAGYAYYEYGRQGKEFRRVDLAATAGNRP